MRRFSSNFDMPEIEERPPVSFGPTKVEKTFPHNYEVVENGKVNAARLIHCLEYNRYIAASVIAPRKNWIELLQTIGSTELIKNVGCIVVQIRQSLGLEVNVNIRLLNSEGILEIYK